MKLVIIIQMLCWNENYAKTQWISMHIMQHSQEYEWQHSFLSLVIETISPSVWHVRGCRKANIVVTPFEVLTKMHFAECQALILVSSHNLAADVRPTNSFTISHFLSHLAGNILVTSAVFLKDMQKCFCCSELWLYLRRKLSEKQPKYQMTKSTLPSSNSYNTNTLKLQLAVFHFMTKNITFFGKHLTFLSFKSSKATLVFAPSASNDIKA